MTYNVFSGTLNPTQSVSRSDHWTTRAGLHWVLFCVVYICSVFLCCL